jgi:hypothetical protein
MRAMVGYWTVVQLRTVSSGPAMSALGQKRTFGGLIDQLVSACEQWQGHREAERLGGLEVDD